MFSMINKLLLLFSICISLSVKGQYLKYSNDFLSIGVGARSAGMGNAAIAGTKDITASYWNPASLTDIEEDYQIGAMHNEQFAGIVKHDYAGISFKPDNKHVIAFSMIRVGVDDIPNTLDLYSNGQIDYSRITNFSAVDYAFIGSIAQKTSIEGLSVGANAKVIRRVIGEFANAWGFGFDIATTYRHKGYRMAAMIRDVTTTFNAWSYSFTSAQKQVLLQTNNVLPSSSLELTAPVMTLGISKVFSVWQDKISIEPEVNSDILFGGKRNVLMTTNFVSLDPRIGLEIGYKNLFWLRGGINRFQSEDDINGNRFLTLVPTAGAGIIIGNLAIDYAIANPGGNSSLPHSNIISLRLGINKS